MGSDVDKWTKHPMHACTHFIWLKLRKQGAHDRNKASIKLVTIYIYKSLMVNDHDIYTYVPFIPIYLSLKNMLIAKKTTKSAYRSGAPL